MPEGRGHRSWVALIGRHPRVVLKFLNIPESEGLTAVTGSENLSSSRFSDNVVIVLDRRGNQVTAAVVDVQRRKEHELKRWVWAQYYYALHVRVKKAYPDCQVRLMVFATTDKVAEWAREPLVHGENSFRPDVVVGPGDVPAITDVEVAKRDPVFAAVSAVLHPRHMGVWRAVLPAIDALAPEERVVLYDLIMSNITEKRAEVVKSMSIDFSEYASDYGARCARIAVKDRDREIAVDQLETRFGEEFSAVHRARVEAATAQQLQRILHTFAKPDVTLDDVLAPLHRTRRSGSANGASRQERGDQERGERQQPRTPPAAA